MSFASIKIDNILRHMQLQKYSSHLVVPFLPFLGYIHLRGHKHMTSTNRGRGGGGGQPNIGHAL